MTTFEPVAFETLIDKTLENVDVSEDEIFFHTSECEVYKMLHWQDSCETVTIEDIAGDISWLIGEPILKAEERTSNSFKPLPEKYVASQTWTFYEIATIKGSVTIRWYGWSNGYYSESVSFVKMNLDKKPLKLDK